MMGEDAFKDGFLSKKFGNRLIGRINRPWKVTMPPNTGSGRVIESDENICLDLTKAKLGWDGTWNFATPPPYLPPWNLYPVGKGTLAIPFTYDSGTGTWTCTNINHGLVLNSPVTITLTTAGGGTMASAFSAGTTYYARDIGDSTLKLSATAGGAAITGGANGSGMTLVYAGLALKINPISTLWKDTAATTAYQWPATYDSKLSVTNFDLQFIHTSSLQVVYMEVTFDSSGLCTAAAIKSGSRWANFPLVCDIGFCWSMDGSGATTVWRQLLAYWTASVSGRPKDANFSGTWYELTCPTTTHLMAGSVARHNQGNTGVMANYPAVVPWYGCFAGS